MKSGQRELLPEKEKVMRVSSIVVVLASLSLIAAPAYAQLDRAVHLRAAIDGESGFRDENGKVWTPDNVGQPDGKPVAPEDRAFDPHQQVVHTPTVSIQVPEIRVVDAVPVLSRPGSAVPVVSLETPALRLANRERWVAPLILANNGERVIDAEISCRFSNERQLVEEARIQLRGIEPGQRVAAVARGPQAHLFVNTAVCAVDSPLQ